jgi:hypothetical protein
MFVFNVKSAAVVKRNQFILREIIAPPSLAEICQDLINEMQVLWVIDGQIYV